MEDFGGFESIGCFVDDDDDDNCSDGGTRTSSQDGYTSAGGHAGRAPTDRRRRGHLDSEHKKRRAIANSNERKRMQSINAGFNSLRNLVCPKSGNKLSKAAILKYTADFIKTLLAEKQRLLSNNRLLEQVLGGTDLDREGRNRHLLSPTSSPLRPGKRRWREMESTSSDEGIGFTAAEEILVTSGNIAKSKSISELHQQIKELEEEVEKEKALRQLIEADKKELELRQLPLSDHQVMLHLLPDSSNERQITTEIQLPDLHNQAWRRGLETIVEAIRHVEGEQGMFGSGDISHPLQKTGLNNTGCSQQERSGSVESSLLLSQFHPVRIRDLSGGMLSSVPNQISFASPFHRPSLAASSS